MLFFCIDLSLPQIVFFLPKNKSWRIPRHDLSNEGIGFVMRRLIHELEVGAQTPGTRCNSSTLYTVRVNMNDETREKKEMIPFFV